MPRANAERRAGWRGRAVAHQHSIFSSSSLQRCSGNHRDTNCMLIYIYIYIYICVCVSIPYRCSCVMHATLQVDEHHRKLMRSLAGICGVSDRTLAVQLDWIRANPEVHALRRMCIALYICACVGSNAVTTAGSIHASCSAVTTAGSFHRAILCLNASCLRAVSSNAGAR